MLKSKSGKRITKPSDIAYIKTLEKTFKDGKNQSVKIGFPSAKSGTNSSDKTGVTALHKATVNNFGLGVPKRPFMAMAFAKNADKYKKFIASSIGKKKQIEILSILGAIGEGDVKQTIRGFKAPPNSDVTIKIKGTNNPLIDSSHMVGSVSWSIT